MKSFIKKIMPRYNVVVVLLTLVGVAVLAKTAHIMFVKKEYWQRVSKLSTGKHTIPLRPMRGNIYSADGQLLVSSLPEYNICMDYICTEKDSALRVKTQHWRDSMINAKADSIGEGLHKLFPEISAQAFTQRLLDGRKTNRRYWKLYKRRVSYTQLQEIRKLPLFREARNKSGFYGEPLYLRKKPFGSLAERTLGKIDERTDIQYGLESAFDSVLRGKWGSSHLQKVLDSHLRIIDRPKEDGSDIITTLDVEMQDITEKALLDKLKEINAPIGLAVLMEVKTGDVKAIVNLSRYSDGVYREDHNYALSNLLEPGSVFKPASFMVAFDDGYLKMDEKVDIGRGVKRMYGQDMKDAGWQNKMVGSVITAAECIQKSSNVGVSSLIDKYYNDKPQKFVDGLYRVGIAADLKLPIPGYAVPRIPNPRDKNRYWWKGTIAWMSIGYATQVPPISTLAFYNGIANGGKMLRPRFVQSRMKDGVVEYEYPVEVVRERMCSPQALDNVKKCLELVVLQGTGKKAHSANFPIAGKTGTAQIWTKAGHTAEYLVSFVGYFPADAPKYSCIVCIRKTAPASGGLQCAPVFKRIAETVMARTSRPSVDNARDTVAYVWPCTKSGNMSAAKSVLSELHVPYRDKRASAEWGMSATDDSGVVLESVTTDDDLVPNVVGMGLRDALFVLESKGLHVKISGVGKVVSQSIPAGAKFQKKQQIRIVLDNQEIKKPKPRVIATDTLSMQGGSMTSSASQTSGNNTPTTSAENVKKSDTLVTKGKNKSSQ